MGNNNTAEYRKEGTGAMTKGNQAAVTQGSSITTTVICNSLTGVITTVSQTVAAGAEAEFQVTNDKVKATDVPVVAIKTHTSAGEFIAAVTAVADGSFKIRLTNLHASNAGNNVLVLNYAVIKCEA